MNSDTTTAPSGWRSGAIRGADRVDLAIAWFCQAVVILVGTLLLALLAANVAARYVLESGGFRFAQELPERLFPVFIMAGVVLAVQRGGHMAVETVLSKLGRTGARNMLVFGHIIVIASYIVLSRDIFELADMLWIDKSPVMGIPSSYGYLTLGGGLVLVILATATQATRVALLGPEAMPVPSPEELVS
ncbi:TRAP transporter small permease subunit [Xanthobacter autotrophicus DSM 597]|uniref:TRAP transporter small permease n=1 Tax=Xanthobacter TaxID=279 RepID=UPI001AE2B9E6|nr:TRAP-type C4-dicarboxylate transport system permease small subunit [Xanthobacter flavus]